MSRVFIPRLALLGLVAAWLPGPASAQQQTGPTFDCARASGEVEALICTDGDLAALDRRMADVYAAAIDAWPEDIATVQRAYQRGWISGRNECWKAEDVRACTELSYRTRIVELQIKSGQLMAPTPQGYACTGEEGKPFFATFYQETDPPSVVITYGDDQVIAFQAPAGSGAKYTASNVEFWEHQGEASVSWYGMVLTCRPRAAAPAGSVPLAR